MINFKLFVEAIHDAIIKANDTLMDENVGLLDKYFIEGTSADNKPIMTPRTVSLEYPHLLASGEISTTYVQVPLITLIPLSTTQIEKATLTSEFEMDIVDGELQVDFTAKSRGGLFGRKTKTKKGKLEITITPQETSEGLKLLVEGYERMLKRQLS